MNAVKFVDIISGFRNGTVKNPGPVIVPMKIGERKIITISSERCIYDFYPGAFTLMYVMRGEAYIETGNSKYKLTPGNYLFLNPGTIYHSFAVPDILTELCTIHFSPDVLDRFSGRNTNTAIQAAGSNCFSGTPSCFVERTYQQNEKIRVILGKLCSLSHAGYKQSPGFDKREFYRSLNQLLLNLFIMNTGVRAEINSMETSRPSTRGEVYQRLYYARDYMDSSYGQGISVQQVAAVACMNADYFTRLYRRQFGITPVKYLIANRMKAAGQELKKRKFSVSEICNKVGYSDISSFGKLFKRHYGLNPEAYNQLMLNSRIPAPAHQKNRLLFNTAVNPVKSVHSTGLKSEMTEIYKQRLTSTDVL
ncbi:MAG: AraC family transcriptional regulator [Chitinophagaceae bacterium]